MNSNVICHHLLPSDHSLRSHLNRIVDAYRVKKEANKGMIYMWKYENKRWYYKRNMRQKEWYKADKDIFKEKKRRKGLNNY